tara:strand:- start:305 stop:460 length:156 start_codon:yes stop_codon:yes gene_type:complete
MEKESKKKMALLKAINNMEGIPIPYPIIKTSIIPLKTWLIDELLEAEVINP